MLLDAVPRCAGQVLLQAKTTAAARLDLKGEVMGDELEALLAEVARLGEILESRLDELADVKEERDTLEKELAAVKAERDYLQRQLGEMGDGE